MDFGKRNLQHMSKIKSSGENKSMVELKYKDSSGNISTRFVEPYKLDGNDFWGYDPEKNSIRRFKVKNIKSIKQTKNTFEPRWNIEMNKLANRIETILEKLASDNDILSKAFKRKLDSEVAEMMANSHEYKRPNTAGALALVKNYAWEKKRRKISELQGINKPIIESKVLDMAMAIKKDKKLLKPFIVVNKIHGINPQSKGKRILLDGHHRMEACKLLGIAEVPVYEGRYTGGAELDTKELKEQS